ncbi:MAG TPA: hypothetical protein VK742_10450, partial [Candidatus Sulfotelmatobacter sp.]|nr:hypothetical protein [Candidatus Sulfotelmatobacter sp.]
VVQEKPHLLIKPSHEFHPRVALAQSFIQFIPDMQGHPGYLSISCHNFYSFLLRKTGNHPHPRPRPPPRFLFIHFSVHHSNNAADLQSAGFLQACRAIVQRRRACRAVTQ